MSAETSAWLNGGNIKVGFTHDDYGKGNPWWFDGSESARQNLYPAAIPLDVVRDTLNMVRPVSVPLSVSHEGRTYNDPSRQVIVNEATGDVFGVFKSGYKIHPYEEWLIENVSTLIDDELQVGSVGLLRNGAVAWVQVEKPGTVESTTGVDFRPWIYATTSLNGTVATEYGEGIQVIVCDNTLYLARKSASQAGKIARRKHTTHSLKNVQEVRDKLEIVFDLQNEFDAALQMLTNTKVSEKEFDQYLDLAYAIPEDKGRGQTLAMKARDNLSTLWSGDARCAPWHGTAFGVVQTQNTYNQHVRTVKGSDGASVHRAERNQENVLKGVSRDDDMATIDKLNAVFKLNKRKALAI
jgi:phage/plasmid-like protein (TIGR03299 family)